MWGWSINYSGSETIEDCGIYIGVGNGCDMSGATQVGTFTISPSIVHYCLDKEWESNAFHFYAGKCDANDAGTHLNNSDTCIAVDEAKYANKWDTYPLKAEGGTKVKNFAFDKSFASTGVYWTSNYKVFEVGTEFRQYLSAHVDVCPVATTASPTASPTPGLTGDTITVPTSSPSSPIKEQGGCEPAWVYCPGRSKCLNDPSFNDGNLAAVGQDGTVDNVWGWSIEYDATASDELVDDCQIIIGATDCDLNTGTVVGTFNFRESYAQFCLARFGYVSSYFSVYSGTCAGNDAGDSLASGTCSPQEIALYAASPDTFPIYSNDGVLTNSFTAESSDAMNTKAGWPADYKMFPMTGKTYMSAYTCVVPKGDTTVEGGFSADSSATNGSDATSDTNSVTVGGEPVAWHWGNY